MSLLQLFTNNAISLLNGSVTASDLELHLLPGTGATFPQPVNPGEFFLVTLEETAAPFTREIVKVIGRVGDVLIIDPAGRAQEGTTARPWAATDTLVDHRLTAETIRQAFLNPPQIPPVGSSLVVTDEGSVLTSAAARINFVGSGVSATAAGDNVTVTINSSSGGEGSINGESAPGAVLVEPAWNLQINEVVYSQFNRGFKYLVTIIMPTNGECETFEVLANIRGLIGTTETVQWTKTNRIGYNFQGQLDVSLDTGSTRLVLKWNNLETQNVQVMVTRIQHAP
jgi:hypothetical protein